MTDALLILKKNHDSFENHSNKNYVNHYGFLNHTAMFDEIYIKKTTLINTHSDHDSAVYSVH